MTARALLEAIYGDWATEKAAGVLRRARENWDAIRMRQLTAEDAETCRQAMLAAISLERYPEATRWRARAMSRFVATDWHEGTIAIMMTEAFRALAMQNDNYENGRTIDVISPSEDALAILEELRPFAIGPGSGHDLGPDPALIARFLYEKQGFLLALQGRWHDAIASYELALEHVETDPRGEVKVTAGLALVRYLRDVDRGGDGRIAAEETATLVARAIHARATDVAEKAKANATVMRRGGRALHPYEFL